MLRDTPNGKTISSRFLGVCVRLSVDLAEDEELWGDIERGLEVAKAAVFWPKSVRKSGVWQAPQVCVAYKLHFCKGLCSCFFGGGLA